MQNHNVVSQDEWLATRKQLLIKEKEFTRMRDRLSAERRELPWVKVEKPYVFDGPNCKESLSQLFERRSQLIVITSCFLRVGAKDARVAHSGRTILTASSFI